MVAANLGSILSQFESSLERSESLYARSGVFLEERNGKLRSILKKDTLALAELSFLVAFLSWEDFLENTFVRYMFGGRSSSGYRPKKYVSPTSFEHAFTIAANGKKYIDWVSPGDVRARAKLYFVDGQPYFDALGSASRELEEMNTLRNAIAHRSEASQRAFERVILRYFGLTPRSIRSPGSLLLAIKPGERATFFEAYISTLRAVAAQIVP